MEVVGRGFRAQHRVTAAVGSGLVELCGWSAGGGDDKCLRAVFAQKNSAHAQMLPP